MKVVFKDDRVGEITDIFCVPTAELSPEQVAHRGLLQSEIDWESANEPPISDASPAARERFATVFAGLQELAIEMNACERARQDIAGWRRKVNVKTAGGSLTLRIDDGDLSFAEGLLANPDFVMVSTDPTTLLDGLAYKGSLTQAIMDRKLWISKNVEFNTIFKLERMARSLARTKKG
jgi:hypothetical protein